MFDAKFFYRNKKAFKMVVESFLAFGFGALLSFLINVDADNVTVLSVAIIAGLLSYMSIFFTEESKYVDSALNDVKAAVFSYLKSIDNLSLMLGFKLIKTQAVREDGSKLEEMFAKIKNDRGNDADIDSFKEMFDKQNASMEEHFRKREDFQLERRRCSMIAIEALEAIDIYVSMCDENAENYLDEVRENVAHIEQAMSLYGNMDDVYASDDILQSESDILDSVHNCQLALRKSLREIRKKRSKWILNRKKKILNYIYIIVFVCLGYLVSDGYKNVPASNNEVATLSPQ